MNAPVRSSRLLLALALQDRALEAHAEAHRKGWSPRREGAADRLLTAFSRACSRLTADEARSLFATTKGPRP